MSAVKAAMPQDLIKEAERLGFQNVEWGDFDHGSETPYRGFLRFESPDAAEAFFELLDDDSIDSFEPGDYSVDVLNDRFDATLEKLQSIQMAPTSLSSELGL